MKHLNEIAEISIHQIAQLRLQCADALTARFAATGLSLCAAGLGWELPTQIERQLWSESWTCCAAGVDRLELQVPGSHLFLELLGENYSSLTKTSSIPSTARTWTCTCLSKLMLEW
jgi:predicted acyltransferase